MTLAAATPTAGFLRFAGYGEKVEVSFDGVRWEKAERQLEKVDVVSRFHSYWTPVPAGVTRVAFRAKKDPGRDPSPAATVKRDEGAWRVRDVAFWAR
jgi:hypothetical protein